MTLRSVVVDALERLVSSTEARPFKLRDASVGYGRGDGEQVSSEEINRALDELNEPRR